MVGIPGPYTFVFSEGYKSPPLSVLCILPPTLKCYVQYTVYWYVEKRRRMRGEATFGMLTSDANLNWEGKKYSSQWHTACGGGGFGFHLALSPTRPRRLPCKSRERPKPPANFFFLRKALLLARVSMRRRSLGGGSDSLCVGKTNFGDFYRTELKCGRVISGGKVVFFRPSFRDRISARQSRLLTLERT